MITPDLAASWRLTQSWLWAPRTQSKMFRKFAVRGVAIHTGAIDKPTGRHVFSMQLYGLYWLWAVCGSNIVLSFSFLLAWNCIGSRRDWNSIRLMPFAINIGHGAAHAFLSFVLKKSGRIIFLLMISAIWCSFGSCTCIVKILHESTICYLHHPSAHDDDGKHMCMHMQTNRRPILYSILICVSHCRFDKRAIMSLNAYAYWPLSVCVCMCMSVKTAPGIMYWCTIINQSMIQVICCMLLLRDRCFVCVFGNGVETRARTHVVA